MTAPAIALRDTDTCQVCKNHGLMKCPADLHGTRDNEYGDCFYCDSDTPEMVTCVCQDA